MCNHLTCSARIFVRFSIWIVVAIAFSLMGPMQHGGAQDAAESVTSHATADQTVAGKTIQQYAQLLDSDNRVVRLRAAKSLGAFGQSAGEVLKTALANDDRAVAYIAAVHLGRIGGESLQAAIEPLTQLADNKESLSLRMAAAFALCRAGQIDSRLSVLTGALTYPDRGTVCSAAELIGMIGADAEPAIQPLEAVHAQNDPAKRNGDYHIGGAAMNALRKIRGE